MRISVPRHITPSKDEGKLLLKDAQHGLRLVAFQSDWAVRGESNAILYEAHKKVLQRSSADFLGRDGGMATGVGDAFHRLWIRRLGDAEQAIGQLLVIPICAGTGSVVIVSDWGTPEGHEMSSQIIASMRPYKADGAPPVCARLNPTPP